MDATASQKNRVSNRCKLIAAAVVLAVGAVVFLVGAARDGIDGNDLMQIGEVFLVMSGLVLGVTISTARSAKANRPHDDVFEDGYQTGWAAAQRAARESQDRRVVKLTVFNQDTQPELYEATYNSGH